MAKSGSAVLADGTFDKKLSRLFLKEVEKILKNLASMKGEYMSRCGSERERIDEVYERAKDAGIPKKIMRAHVKRRELELKLEGLSDFEDAEDITKYQQLYLALEDEPPASVADALKKSSARTGKGMPGAEAAATH